MHQTHDQSPPTAVRRDWLFTPSNATCSLLNTRQFKLMQTVSSFVDAVVKLLHSNDLVKTSTNNTVDPHAKGVGTNFLPDVILQFLSLNAILLAFKLSGGDPSQACQSVLTNWYPQDCSIEMYSRYLSHYKRAFEVI